MLNEVRLIGRLGHDPDTRYTQDGTCICNLSLATSEKYKDRNGEQQEKTEWHKLELWGRLGEIANQYLNKGSLIYVEGKITTQKWQDRDGQDRYTVKIRCHKMLMLGGNDRSNSQDGRQQAGGGSSDPFPTHGGSAAQSNPNRNDPFADSPDFVDVPIDDDIPF